MPTGKHVVIPNTSWTNTSVERCNIAMATDTNLIMGPAETISVPPVDRRPTCAAPSPSKGACFQSYFPTQTEVDAYVNSLEEEVAAERVGIRRNEQAHKPTSAEARSSNVLWWFLAIAVACVWWLLKS